MEPSINILIPMAGLGSRFNSTHPGEHKPYIDVDGSPMIEAVILNNNQIHNSRFIFVVRKELPQQKLKRICEFHKINYEIICIDKLTEGSACTCLMAEELINTNIPLIITNCDQITYDLDINSLLLFSEIKNADGILGAFYSDSPKNSYMKLNSDGEIVDIREKIVISNLATNGFHFWKQGDLFVKSAKKMISENERYNNEFYVAPTYNHLIKDGYRILPYNYNLHFPIGIPEDLNNFKEVINRTKTWMCIK